MIFDAETLPGTWFAERAFDVCVIGSGPAGLTLARKLAASGKRVALMEGGGRDISWDSEELYEGDSVGAEYWPLTACRKRFLGGSSNVMWAREAAGREASPKPGIIDTQRIKTTESGGPCGYNAGKRVKGRKRGLVTDTIGLPVAVDVHLADIQDREGQRLCRSRCDAPGRGCGICSRMADTPLSAPPNPRLDKFAPPHARPAAAVRSASSYRGPSTAPVAGYQASAQPARTIAALMLCPAWKHSASARPQRSRP